jgi:outer membrane biosynthesis protein TonB
VFDELAADGGQESVDLELVQRKTAVFEKGDSANEPDEPDESSCPLIWALAVMIVTGVGATLFALNNASNEAAQPQPKPAVAREDAVEAAPGPAPSAGKLVALEIATERIGRAIDSSRQAQPKTPKQPPKPAQKTPSVRVETTAKKKKNTRSAPIVPVLTQAGARRIIDSHGPEITACFEKGLLRDADFGGKVEVRMVIAPDGTVANADVVKSTVDASDVQSCIVGQVKSWTFPEPSDGRVKILTTPFRFQAPDVNKK